jgi:hypothetical protein
MSTVILLKDRPPQKTGDTISVPFVVGRQMVADGEAKYPESPVPATPTAEDPAKVMARVREQHAAQIEKLTAEYEQKLAEVAAERDAAVKELAGKKQK